LESKKKENDGNLFWYNALAAKIRNARSTRWKLVKHNPSGIFVEIPSSPEAQFTGTKNWWLGGAC
jgi:hypothetical protein